MKSGDDRIVLAHGGGGELTRRLVEERIAPKLAGKLLAPLDDSAVLDVEKGRFCFTTDAHVIVPLEFPGGDIGKLAVCGTVNDIAVMGAEPLALSVALVLEEGLELAVFDRIIDSIAAAAKEAGVEVATGDTKVVERARGDGMTITTSGIGRVLDGVGLGAARIEEGDIIIVSGNIAEHGLAVMAAREGLGLDTKLESDVAPLAGTVRALCESGADVKFLRDPTRGGLSGVLCDLAGETGLSLEVNEADVPITAIARHTSELLGLDPLTVANEGKFVAVVAAGDEEKALAALKGDAYGANAAIIGRFTAAAPAIVELVTSVGGRRMIRRPYGEELPRIC